MNAMHRHTAALSAAVILLQGFGTGLPAAKLIPHNTVRSAAAFCTMLQTAPEPDAEPFEELRYDPAADQLLCDGRPVGKSYGGFTVSEGKLIAESGSGGQLTAEQAAETMGCGIVTEADGSLTVRSPFQTARLVVKGTGTVDPQGGRITAEGYNDLHVIQYDTPQDAYRAYLAYQTDSSISFAQPDRIRRVDDNAVPETKPASDTGDYDEDFWGYEAIGAADYLAWLGEHHPAPPEITVAVLDTGIYAAHSWFQGRIRENGIDCTDSSVYALDDRQGHGTHCAGIICRSTPESVKILPVKVIADDGYGSDLMIYCGIMYAVEQKSDVISMSLGGDGDAPLMMEGIKAAAEADIPVCVAAGNSGYDADYSAPGCYETVFCISAVGYDGRGLLSPDYSDLSRYSLCSFSNRGVEIDFTAPGSEIISAGISAPDNLTFMSGTSMAAPFAAAACADLLSADSDLTTVQLRRMLHNLAIKLPAPDDLDIPAADCYGSGLINLRGAFVTAEYIAPPVITVTGGRISGTYCEAAERVSITITAQKQDDPVYYTTDGSEPDALHGTLYTGEFTLRKSAVIRAAVIRSDAFSNSAAVSVCIGGNETDTDPYTVEGGVLTAYNGVLSELDLTKDFAEGYLHAIGDGAFMRSNLKSVILPDSVTSVGAQAFFGTPLKRFTGYGVTEIGDSAFAETDLSELETAALTKLGRGAFRKCDSLLSSPVLADSLTEIPAYAFADCSQMRTLRFDHEKLTKIGAYAFNSVPLGCDLKFPKLTELGEGAFYASTVTSVTLPETITVLEDFVFDCCSEMKELYAPGVTEIGSLALSGCPALTVRPDWSKIKKLRQVALASTEFADDLTFFDAIEEMDMQAVSGTTGGALVFPTLTEVPAQFFIAVDNLIWVPNAESVVLKDDEIKGIRVSEKLKYAEILSRNSCSYIIGPKDSCIREEAEKKGILYIPEQALTPGDTAVSVQPGTAFTLYAAYAADPETVLTWYEIRDGKETAAAPEAVTCDGRPCDLNRSALTGTISEPGTYQYRAVLTGHDGFLESADYTVIVTEKAASAPQQDLNYTPDSDASGYADRVYKVGETIPFIPEISYYTIYSDEPCKVRLCADNRNVQMLGRIESRVYGTDLPASGSDFTELQAGFSRLYVETGMNDSVFRMPLTFRLEKVQNSLKLTEITPLNAVYTGKPIRPAFRISADGEQLTEGTDYRLAEDLTVTDPGTYCITVTGIGDYYDEVIAPFTVLPQTDSTALTEGTQTVTLKNADPVIYRWTPEKNQYGITADSLHQSILTVYEPDGTAAVCLRGTGYRYQLLNVTPGAEYRISVTNLYPTESAEVTFSVQPDCRLLDDAEIEITKIVRYGEQPVYTLTENGSVLTEGTDFTVSVRGTQEHIGSAYLAFRGCGSYIGETDITYCIAPEDTATFPDVPIQGHPQAHTLDAGELLRCTVTRYPGTVERYFFTAPCDGSYQLTLPDQEQQNVSVLLYVNDGIPVLAEETEMPLELRKDDSLLIMVISDYLLFNVIQDYTRPYAIGVTGGITEHEAVIGGIRYRIEDFQATVIGIETTDSALNIPSAFLDPLNGEPTTVTGIEPAAFAPYAETCTILTERGGTMAEYCEQQGYHYMLSDSDFAVRGDVNGNGKMDYHDVILLQQYLTECGGIQFTAEQAAAADLNQDGSLTMRDLTALMQQLEPPTGPPKLAYLSCFDAPQYEAEF